jgi:DNA repair protein RadC
LRISQAKAIFIIKREIWSRSSEKEGNDMQVETPLSEERKLENLDIVKVLLVRDSGSSYRKQPVAKSEDVVSVAKKFLAGEDREVFITINLDQSLKINSIHVVSIGSLNMALIHPREVFKAAILSNASRVILAHNHPSGNPEPSDDDNRITCQLFQCGDLLGIEVMDHIIIGDGEYSHCMKISKKDKNKEIVWLKGKIEKE